MRQRLGCLAPQGLVAAGLTLVLIAAVVLIWGGSLFAPGSLNAQAGTEVLGGIRSHADIGGKCSACHAAPWDSETMSDRCLTCHEGIKRQLEDGGTVHGMLAAAGSVLPCYSCHGEHQGSDGSLTRIDAETFPHQATGFSLEGHRQGADGDSFGCAECHGQELARFDPARCAQCHGERDGAFVQAHARDFGDECLSCHDGVDRYGAGFDHDTLAFPLQGGHAGVGCRGCHPDARSPADLQAAPQVCYACHEADDAHAGEFGRDCAACHTPQAWEEATFDHDLAAFPLEGAHQQVECRACHEDGVFAGTPQACYACHEADDAHAGEFGRDCAACHTPQAWEEATFDHDLAAFPLEGAHQQVECRACHEDGVFAGTPQACYACHEEPAYHTGLLGTDCVACHDANAWAPAAYGRAHLFPLDHGEAGASPCRTCHPDHLAAYTCYGCHEHDRAEIASKHREEGITSFEDCVECHPTGLEDEAEDRSGSEGGDD